MTLCKNSVNGCGKEADSKYDGFCSFECSGGYKTKAHRDMDREFDDKRRAGATKI